MNLTVPPSYAAAQSVTLCLSSGVAGVPVSELSPGAETQSGAFKAFICVSTAVHNAFIFTLLAKNGNATDLQILTSIIVNFTTPFAVIIETSDSINYKSGEFTQEFILKKLECSLKVWLCWSLISYNGSPFFDDLQEGYPYAAYAVFPVFLITQGSKTMGIINTTFGMLSCSADESRTCHIRKMLSTMKSKSCAYYVKNMLALVVSASYILALQPRTIKGAEEIVQEFSSKNCTHTSTYSYLVFSIVSSTYDLSDTEGPQHVVSLIAFLPLWSLMFDWANEGIDHVIVDLPSKLKLPKSLFLGPCPLVKLKRDFLCANLLITLLFSMLVMNDIIESTIAGWANLIVGSILSINFYIKLKSNETASNGVRSSGNAVINRGSANTYFKLAVSTIVSSFLIANALYALTHADKRYDDGVVLSLGLLISDFLFLLTDEQTLTQKVLCRNLIDCFKTDPFKVAIGVLSLASSDELVPKDEVALRVLALTFTFLANFSGLRERSIDRIHESCTKVYKELEKPFIQFFSCASDSDEMPSDSYDMITRL